MSERRPFQKNAADPKQGRHAERLVRRRKQLFDDSLHAVMNTPEGRVVFGELLEDLGLHRTPFNTNGSLANFNMGRQNFGFELQAMLVEAAESLYDLMESERRARRRAEDRETEAVQTPRAEEGSATM